MEGLTKERNSVMIGWSAVRRNVKPRIGAVLCTVLVFLGVSLGGCHSPDLQPFAEATSELHQGVTVSQQIFHQRVLSVDPNALDSLDRFDREWAKRVAAMEALVNYADALAGIAESGKMGRQNAKALGTALEPVFNTMGVSGLAGSEAFAVGGQLYGLIAEAAAARSLSRAVDRAHPIIERICDILYKDVSNLTGVLMTAEVPILMQLEAPLADQIAARDKLVDRRQKVTSQLGEAVEVQSRIRDKLIEERQKVLKELANAPDPNDAGLLGKIEKINDLLKKDALQVTVLSEELEGVNKDIGEMEEWHKPYGEKLARIEKEFRTQIEMLTTLCNGFVELKKVHKGIGQALRENRKPNVRVLLNTAIEIKTIIEERNAQ